MALVALTGERHAVNEALLLMAVREQPRLIVDCANSADPHRLYPRVMPEELERVYVLEVELLYKLRDAVRRLPGLMRRYGPAVITTFNRLMHYHDEEENGDVIQHTWELLRAAGREHDIIVGAERATVQERLARHYCTTLVDAWDTPLRANDASSSTS